MVGQRVYVGGLSYGARERDLERFFKGYGRLREILIKNGYGFVEFEDRRDADEAIYELNGMKLLGRRVVVEPTNSAPRGRGVRRERERRRARSDRRAAPTRTAHRVIVENLSPRISWRDLKDYMRKSGEVTYAEVNRQGTEGVVEFATLLDMRIAIAELDETELKGRRIRVLEDGAPSQPCSQSRCRSRSRSGSRKSRTRSTRSRSSSTSSCSTSRSLSGDRSESRSRSPSSGSDLVRSRSRSVQSESRSRSRSLSSESKSVSRSRSRSCSSSSSLDSDGLSLEEYEKAEIDCLLL